MQDYTLYCTELQTKQAYKLGAPIEKHVVFFEGCVQIGKTVNNEKLYGIIPTAEQMIGWFYEQEWFSNICINKTMGGNYSSSCYCSGETLLHKIFPSRKEAILAAIDATLEYIEKKGE